MGSGRKLSNRLLLAIYDFLAMDFLSDCEIDFVSAEGDRKLKKLEAKPLIITSNL